jgi:exodeoxyribonuclease V alpha subunit
MTDSRLLAAAEHSHLMVDAGGLLAAFNDAGVLNPLDVQAAAAIGRLLGESDERVLLAAALTVRGARFGHVCIRLDAVREAVVVDGQDPEEIEALPWPDLAEWEASLAASPLVGDATTDTPAIFEEGRLYLERYYRYEQLVAQLITSRLEIVPPVRGKHRPATEEPGGRGEALLTQLLDEGSRQHDAARLALTSRVSVIAGGPGTGKTHTIAAMLAALAAGKGEFPKVALCAPTGKAAARLGEAVAEMAASLDDEQISEALATVEPGTMHRLLGWTWGRGRFAYNAAHRLPHDLVIVDEMSMVSLPMAAKLLQAVRDDATAVLVGDPYQLESIEAGTVLADIVGAAEDEGAPIAGNVVVLDRVHRFEEDSAIADFAEAVRLGNADTAVELLRAGEDPLQWVEDRSASGFGELWEAVLEQRTRMVALAQHDPQSALEALTEIAVLCARRTGRDGVSLWGRDIETALDERFTGLRWGSEWYPGRPVMVTTNDYRLDLYNGDIGICVKIGETPLVVFERNGLRTVPPSHLGDHSTVHAMTIHKSQGSQFEEVVVVLPGESSRLLTRELLYTAVTRASARVRIVGDEDVVRRAIERSVQRASGLGTRLVEE